MRSSSARAREALTREGIAPDKQSFLREMDLRYVGQSFELKVPIPSAGLERETLTTLEQSFHKIHERVYGHCAPEEPVEIVNLRLTAQGLIPKPRIRKIPATQDGAKGAVKAHRKVLFRMEEGYVSTPVYDRYKLLTGAEVVGPAVVEEFDSTVLIHPGHQAGIDEFGSLHILPATAA